MTQPLGIDISRWQTVTPPLGGLQFVMAKATEADGYADPMYTTHARNVLAAGLYLGSYHFIRNSAEIDAQARWYVSHSPNAQALAVDNEGQHALGRTGTRSLIAAIKSHDPLHRKVGLYMSESPYASGGFKDCGQDFSWIANWSKQPSVAWDIWQYQGTGLDRDTVNSQATLDRIFNVQPATHTVHIAHDALVRAYAISSRGCILKVNGKYGVDRTWTGEPSQAPCAAPVYRKTCDGISHSTTVKVLGGVFAGKHIGLNAGVTVS